MPIPGQCYKKPYFQCGSVTLYRGRVEDYMDVLPKCDLLLTDPPYGIGEIWQGGSGRGWGKSDKEKGTRNEWDAIAPSQTVLDALRSKTQCQVIWGGNYFNLPPSRGWYIWVKPERGFTLSEAEMAWTNIDTIVRCFDAPRHVPRRIHPTQKPLELFLWCLSKFPKSVTVLDPYAGSGTTAIACIQIGKKCILIEQNPTYCEYIVRRITREMSGIGGESKYERQLEAKLQRILKSKR